MADWELWAPDDATMVSTLQQMALRNASGRSGSCIFATDYYGVKRVGGVDQPGRYANIRWIGPTAVPALPAGSPCTIKVLAAPIYQQFSP